MAGPQGGEGEEVGVAKLAEAEGEEGTEEEEILA